MVRNMRKMLLVSLILISTILPVYALDWAITGGAISFFPLGPTQSIPDGLYGQGGVRLLITPKIEFELGVVAQLTPDITETIGGSALIGINLLGDIEPTYFNMIADVGMLYLIEQDTGDQHPMIFLRISPLVIGNPYYSERARLLTAGMLYDTAEDAFTLTFSMGLMNWFVSSWK